MTPPADRVSLGGPGDPIRAAEWNLVGREVNKLVRAGRRADAGAMLPRAVLPSLTVLVRNDTGGPLPAFSPVRFGATLTGLSATPPLPFESRDRPCFEGLECDGEGVHAVLQEALPEDAIGRAAVMGLVVARVAAGLAAGDMVQPPASSNSELIAGGSFARLVTAPVGSGDAMALVLVGGGGGGPGLIAVKQTAVTATAADTDTAATVQKFNTSGVWVNDTELVVFRPKDSGMLQKAGTVWLCVDTGTVTGDTPPKRKLRGVVPPLVKRQVHVGCTEANVPLYAGVWVPDVN